MTRSRIAINRPQMQSRVPSRALHFARGRCEGACERRTRWLATKLARKHHDDLPIPPIRRSRQQERRTMACLSSPAAAASNAAPYPMLLAWPPFVASPGLPRNCQATQRNSATQGIRSGLSDSPKAQSYRSHCNQLQRCRPPCVQCEALAVSRRRYATSGASLRSPVAMHRLRCPYVAFP